MFLARILTPWQINPRTAIVHDPQHMFRIPPYLGTKQCHITPTMRSILVDWLVEIQENFELNHETLYLAVKLTDLYMSRVEVDKEVLQLLGSAAVFIASKFDVSIKSRILAISVFFFYSFYSLIQSLLFSLIFYVQMIYISTSQSLLLYYTGVDKGTDTA